jgi:hypothetical protein
VSCVQHGGAPAGSQAPQRRPAGADPGRAQRVFSERHTNFTKARARWRHQRLHATTDTCGSEPNRCCGSRVGSYG